MISNWWDSNKRGIILMGVVGILLALFLVSAITRVSYETSLEGGEYAGKSFIETFPELVKEVNKNISIAFGEGFEIYANHLKTFAVIYLVLVIMVIYKLSSRNEYENIEHGSGDWCKGGEEYKILSPKEGVILAKKRYLPVIPNPPEAKNGNILVIGGSGSGKSAAFAIPNAMQMLGSYVFTDPKGELYDRTAGIFKQKGYNIHVINLADPRYSDGYNPLSHIRGTTDVDIIAKIISKKDEVGGKRSSDPFWDQTSEALLKAIIYYILLNRPKEEHSLASCLSLVRLGGQNEGEDLINLFMELPFDNPARRSFETIRLGSEKTFSNILVSLAAKLEAFDSEEIVALTSTNTIEFEDLARKRSVVYFITPESHNTYDFLMNIFFSQLFQRLYEFGDKNGGKLPIPMFLVLDEFANIGRIPNFERVLSTCRSKALHISIILQSIDQLMEIYDEKVTENIMANCSTHLFLGSNAQKTLETFSKQLGEKTIFRGNVSTSRDKESKVSSKSYSDQIMARALMTPDELRRMNAQECIILIQGLRPIKAEKYWYYKMHPLAKLAKEIEISHLNFEMVKRGEYKITNPYELKGKSYDLTNIDDIEVEKIAGNNAIDGNQKEEEFYDIQAELEKKFDELFGSPKKN